MGELTPEDRKRVARHQQNLRDLHEELTKTTTEIIRLEDEMKKVEKVRKLKTGEKMLVNEETGRAVSLQNVRIELRHETRRKNRIMEAIREQARRISKIKEKLGTE